MIGTVEFVSTTLYRYATLNIDQLNQNLGSAAATDQAVEVFTNAFVQSMPTGKQATFANRTLPDAVIISLRNDQPVNCVGAFEKAVSPGLSGSGYVTPAAEALATYIDGLDQGWGGKAEATLVARVGDAAIAVDRLGHKVAMNDLGAKVVAALSNAEVAS